MAEPEIELTDELTLDQPVEPETADDELLLGDELAAEEAPVETAEAIEEAPATGSRSWLTREETPAEEPAARPRAEPCSSGCRTSPAAPPRRRSTRRTEDGPRLRTGREPLDIPRFLNRQNNQ